MVVSERYARSLLELSQSLDWQARGMSPDDTTLTTNMAYVDDSADRRIKTLVGFPNTPQVGTKQSDLALVEPLKNILPWLVDRRSVPDKWWMEHQNGRVISENQHQGTSDQAYVAAWVLTAGEVTLYYPPMSVYKHPFTLAEVLGANFSGQDSPFVLSNLPANNPSRSSMFSKPGVHGLSLITAQTPVYNMGPWNVNDYNPTYIASVGVGVEIAVSSVSSYLDVLQGREPATQPLFSCPRQD